MNGIRANYNFRPNCGSKTSWHWLPRTGRQQRLLGKRPNPNTDGITVRSFADPDLRRQVVHHSFMETPHVARSERSPLRIVFTENEPEGARTEGSGDGEMKFRRATIVRDEWHGEFGSYDEWARLGPQPLTGQLPFLMLMGDIALLSVTLLGHGTIGHFHCGIVGKGLSYESAARHWAGSPLRVEC